MPATMRLHFREPTVDTNRPIADGTVAIEGFAGARAERAEDADAWDCGFAQRMLHFGAEPAWISIPAFPNRKFRQSYIYVNAGAGIDGPRGLEGRRVGIRMWANTAGVWARGALRHHYGVALETIRWVAARADETPLPASIKIDYLRGRNDVTALDTLLLAGEIDAVIDPDVPPSIVRNDPRVRRLFADSKAEEKDYFAKTGIFPISHLMTLRQSFVERHPEAPVALLAAFRRARDIAIQNIAGSDPQILIFAWAQHALAEQRALMGEPYFPYDVAHNRTALGAMMRYAHEQYLTRAPVEYEALFAPTAMALPGA